MRLHLIAVGRLKPGPEVDLLETYRGRLRAAPAKLGPLDITEIDERKEPQRALLEATRRRQPGTMYVALDETGEEMSTKALAERLARWRDSGAGETAFIIGSADGLTGEIRGACDLVLSLGRMTWPHRLARAMLAEQLYRAASLLAGHPYHRE